MENRTARLTILIDPIIVVQPLSQSIPTGGTVTLSVTVTNTATLPVNFRWRRGSVTFRRTRARGA